MALVIAALAAYMVTHRASAPTIPADTANTIDTTDTSTTTDDSGMSVPHINSVTPTTARIGDKIEIRGTHFSGFEGDKYAWIENAAGVPGIIYGDMLKATDSYITFTLDSKYCMSNTSYSGNDCPSYLDIVPGTYKIFVQPWGTVSNKVEFTVVK
jgi:hypothetical protein